jgi:hypothetical protein
MKKLFFLAALVLGIVAIDSTAFAQNYTCTIVNGVKCRVDLDSLGNPIDTICPGGSTGSGTFNSTTGPIPSQGPLNVRLLPVNINATVVDPTLGPITITLTQGATATPTTIVSNFSGVRFPASVKISFPATATSSAGTFVSNGELVFRSNNVNSVNPFVNETFTLQNDVSFHRPGQQQIAFRLRAAGSFVTLSNGGGLQ